MFIYINILVENIAQRDFNNHMEVSPWYDAAATGLEANQPQPPREALSHAALACFAHQHEHWLYCMLHQVQHRNR